MKTWAVAMACLFLQSQPLLAEEAIFEELRPEKNRVHWTVLTSKAAGLRLGMTLSEVVYIMGSPDYVTTVGDDREWYSFATRGYELYWINGRCNPVEAQFPDGQSLTGWDGGRAACAPAGKSYPNAFLPPHYFACDRRRLPPC